MWSLVLGDRWMFFPRTTALFELMFVESEFSWTVTVQPDEFTLDAGQLRNTLIRNLFTQFDNTTCTEEHGYFVAVTWIQNVGEGIIWEGKGCITYPVLFRGLTFKPLTGEIVYGVVSKVSELGVIADCGPEEIAIIAKSGESSNMGEYEYHKEEGVWKHTDDGTQIEQGTAIRAEIVKIEWLKPLKTFKTHCSLKGDFLGVVELPSTT